MNKFEEVAEEMDRKKELNRVLRDPNTLEELNKVVQETLNESAEQTPLMSELGKGVPDDSEFLHPDPGQHIARSHDINKPKSCGCSPRINCRCIQYNSYADGPWKPLNHNIQTPYGQISSAFDFAVLEHRDFWQKFVQYNNYPLGYLAGIRAMTLVQENETLKAQHTMLSRELESNRVALKVSEAHLLKRAVEYADLVKELNRVKEVLAETVNEKRKIGITCAETLKRAGEAFNNAESAIKGIVLNSHEGMNGLIV